MNKKIWEDSCVESAKFRQLCVKFNMPDLIEKDKKFMDAQRKELFKKSNEKSKFAWIGLNPPPNTYTLKELYELCVDKFPYRGYEMVAEQFTQGGIRPHLHILLKVSDNSRKNHIISRLAKSFEMDAASVQVRISNNYSLIDRWQKYIQGEKSDTKMEYVNNDKEYRQNNNIPHIYRDVLSTSGCNESQEKAETHHSFEIGEET